MWSLRLWRGSAHLPDKDAAFDGLTCTNRCSGFVRRRSTLGRRAQERRRYACSPESPTKRARCTTMYRSQVSRHYFTLPALRRYGEGPIRGCPPAKATMIEHNPTYLQGGRHLLLHKRRIVNSIHQLSVPHVCAVGANPEGLQSSQQEDRSSLRVTGPVLARDGSPCCYRQSSSPASAPCEGCPRSRVHALALKRHYPGYIRSEQCLFGRLRVSHDGRWSLHTLAPCITSRFVALCCK